MKLRLRADFAGPEGSAPRSLPVWGVRGLAAVVAGAFATSGVTRAVDPPPPSEARVALGKWFAAGAKVRTVQVEFDQLRNLRSVRQPLRKQGRMWMEKDSGQFRWQVGEPPELLALRNREGTLTVLDAKRKQANVWSRELLADEAASGTGQAFGMFRAMQQMSLADFDKQFELDAGVPDPADAARWRFDWKFKDARTALVVLKLSFEVHLGDGTLQSFTMHMRDGSRMSTIIRSQVLNRPVPPEIFAVDTTGYEVKQEGARP